MLSPEFDSVFTADRHFVESLPVPLLCVMEQLKTSLLNLLYCSGALCSVILLYMQNKFISGRACTQNWFVG